MVVKSSFYNELIPIPETQESLLYNIATGGLNVLGKEVSDFLLEVNGKSFVVEEGASKSQLLFELYNDGFLVDPGVDERELYKNNYAKSQQWKFDNNPHLVITVGTTILCNMGCPYCFQAVKPNKSLRDEKVILGIVNYLEDVIVHANVKKWGSLGITWYGGEPLVNQEAIARLTGKLVALTDKYSIPYDASMVTNGILLSKETWRFLVDNRVGSVQVTIDGSKETHDRYRPLKNSGQRNYEQIMENLSMMPEEMQATIRINTDKKVAASLSQLMDDLEKYGIWPQRHQAVSVTLACLRPYPGADIAAMQFLTEEEFFETKEAFSQMKVDRFNKWSSNNGGPKAKVKWRLPEKQTDCATYVSPYAFVFGPEGSIHKCWETIHESDKSSGHDVFGSWKPENFERYLGYSRTKVHPTCYNCKFNPVCEGLSCSYDALAKLEEDKFPCTPWKTKLDDYFKRMYLMSRENPDAVSLGSAKGSDYQTHANK